METQTRIIVEVLCVGYRGARIKEQLEGFGIRGVVTRLFDLTGGHAFFEQNTYGFIPVLIAELIEPGFGNWIDRLIARQEEYSKRLHIFSVYPYAEEKTNVAANEVLRKLRQLEPCVAEVRIVNLPDYEAGSADPHWPIGWSVDGLENSDKQIVLEVILLLDKLTSSINRHSGHNDPKQV